MKMRIINPPYLPENFDFSNSRLLGAIENYDFVEVLGRGSQGLVMKYRSHKGTEVVYKFYSGEDNPSTRIGSSPRSTFHQKMLEHDYLSILSVYARAAAHKTFSNRYFYHDHPHDEMCVRTAYNEITNIRRHPFAKFPIYVDKAYTIVNTKNRKEYRPLLRPPQMAADAQEMSAAVGEFVQAHLYSYESGETLDKWLMREHSHEEREKVAIEILKAAMCPHSVGIMHDDLKPQNLILTKYGIKAIDFGIARFFAPSDRVAFRTGLVKQPIPSSGDSDEKGSRLFSGPRNKYHLTLNTEDIFSAGLLAALALTGEHPFLGEKSNFREFMDLPEEQQKQIKRDYSSKVAEAEDDENVLRELEVTHQRFLSKHDCAFLRSTGTMFHPDERKRPPVMFIGPRRLGIELPPTPEFYHSLELSRAMPNHCPDEYFEFMQDAEVVDYYDFQEQFISESVFNPFR